MGSSAERVFAVAIRRECRSEVPSDWVEIVRQIDGVSIESSMANSRRILVRTSVQGAERIRQAFGGLVLVEDLVSHLTA